MRFEGKTYLVTGASSGIGLAVAQRLAREGARIVAVARSEEKLRTEASNAFGEWLPIPCDLSVDANVKQLAESLRNQQIVVHGIVHCAGIHALRPLKLIGSEDLTQMYASHLVSSVLLCRYFSGMRILATEGAAIVLVGSAAALRGASGTIAYSAAKAAMVAATKSLAVELAGKKIRVNIVSPGVVRTPQSEKFLGSLPESQRLNIEQGHPLGLGLPADVAGAAAFLLSEDARWITGINLIVDGGLTLQ